MSLFKVLVNKIESVQHHPNADRLDLVKMEGLNWQCVTGRDQYKSGDKVIYFPIDSVLPDTLSEKLGVKNFLAGSGKNRVKTVKLRGCISQGLVAKPETVLSEEISFGDDLTEKLGVVKYEIPETTCNMKTQPKYLKPLPDGVSVYDIEGADNYPEVISYLMNKKVIVSEKLEGTNFSVTLDYNGKFWVNQRKFTILKDGEFEHAFWKVTQRMDLEKRLRDIVDKWKEGFNIPTTVTLRGELVGPGIQKNPYAFNDLTLFFFDVLVNDRYMPAYEFELFCKVNSFEPCPILASNYTLAEWLEGKSIQEASNGTSKLFDTAREGIVVKPYINEEYRSDIGRLIIKQRSPEYLAKTEF